MPLALRWATAPVALVVHALRRPCGYAASLPAAFAVCVAIASIRGGDRQS
jgi:hypothetical protein